MNAGRLNDLPDAPLSGSLLARKGTANATGFAPAPDVAPQEAARPRILIVEDDFLNRRLMTELFEGYGYGTLQAENGHEAIMVARASGPDLIVMDIQLPGLSGVDVVKQLKSDGDLMDVPVIGVSAMTRSKADELIRSAGFDEFISKPFDVGNMLLTVSRFLHEAPPLGAEAPSVAL